MVFINRCLRRCGSGFLGVFTRTIGSGRLGNGNYALGVINGGGVGRGRARRFIGSLKVYGGIRCVGRMPRHGLCRLVIGTGTTMLVPKRATL